MVNGIVIISGILNVMINYVFLLNDWIVIVLVIVIFGIFFVISLVLFFDWSIDYFVIGEVVLVYIFMLGIWDGDAGDGFWGMV